MKKLEKYSDVFNDIKNNNSINKFEDSHVENTGGDPIYNIKPDSILDFNPDKEYISLKNKVNKSNKYILKPENYRNEFENSALNEALKHVVARDTLIEYSNMKEKMRQPDLLGKTVKVTKNQFSDIYNIIEWISSLLDIKPVPCYIYEDFFYGADTEGYSNPWIEISSKTVADFSRDELIFLLAKQLAHLHLNHLEMEILLEGTLECYDILPSLNLTSILSNIPGIDMTASSIIETYKTHAKFIFFNWNRISIFSADACGLIMCGSIKAAFSSIIKMIMNNLELANSINFRDYLNQAHEIYKLSDLEQKFSKYDEIEPYGPYRLKELLKFSSSNRGKKYIVKTKQWRIENGF